MLRQEGRVQRCSAQAGLRDWNMDVGVQVEFEVEAGTKIASARHVVRFRDLPKEGGW